MSFLPRPGKGHVIMRNDRYDQTVPIFAVLF
jgi:hypothetical protein